MIRLNVTLPELDRWLKLFDPRGGSLFLESDAPPEVGELVRLDLTLAPGGPRIIFHGHVLWRREPVPDSPDPAGFSMALSIEEREKVNFVNGYVRGGLIDRRERRRLPLHLPVTFGGFEGPERAYCRDINEDGIFIVTPEPLPEDSELVMLVTLPTVEAPIKLKGHVGHTVIVEDEDVPGMGVRFEFASDEERQSFAVMIDSVEEAFLSGRLPDEVIG